MIRCGIRYKVTFFFLVIVSHLIVIGPALSMNHALPRREPFRLMWQYRATFMRQFLERRTRLLTHYRRTQSFPQCARPAANFRSLIRGLSAPAAPPVQTRCVYTCCNLE